MIKKIVFSVLLWVSVTALYSQIPQDTILYKTTKYMPNYIIYDDLHYKWQYRRSYLCGNRECQEYLLYKDSTLISTNQGIDMKSYCYDKKNNRYYWNDGNDFWYFDLNNDSIKQIISIKTTEGYIISTINDGKIYYSNYPSLCIRDLSTHNIIDSTNICKEFEYHSINELIKFSNTNSVWLILADIDGGELIDVKYCIYDEISKQYSLSNNNDVLRKIDEDNYYGVRCYDLSGQYVFKGEFVYDSNFNLFSKIQIFDVNIYGLVISNREIKQLLLKSNLDLQKDEKERAEVLIPFIPDPYKEKAIYEIYENIELTAQDLQRFDAFDLRLLRNMIFAKHNYAFKDKFLQAYFNLYSFYGYQTNRLTDVSKLLTPTDKKNLTLIQQVSKQKEK